MNDKHNLKRTNPNSSLLYSHKNVRKLNYYSRYSPKRKQTNLNINNQSPLTDRSSNSHKKQSSHASQNPSRNVSINSKNQHSTLKSNSNNHQNQSQSNNQYPRFQIISQNELIEANHGQNYQAQFFQPIICQNRTQIYIDEDQQQPEQKDFYPQRYLNRADNVRKESQSDSFQRFIDDSHYRYSGNDSDQQNKMQGKPIFAQSNNQNYHKKLKFFNQNQHEFIIIPSSQNQGSIYIQDDQHEQQTQQDNTNQLEVDQPEFENFHQLKSQNQSFSIESDLSQIQQNWNSYFDDDERIESIQTKKQVQYKNQNNTTNNNKYPNPFILRQNKNDEGQNLPTFSIGERYNQQNEYTYTYTIESSSFKTEQQQINLRQNNQSSQDLSQFQQKRQSDKILSRHFTFASEINSPEMLNKSQSPQNKNSNTKSEKVSKQKQFPMIKKIISQSLAQKIIYQQNVKNLKRNAKIKNNESREKQKGNFRKLKKQDVRHTQKDDVRRSLFKQARNQQLENKQIQVLNFQDSGVNTQRSTGQVIQDMTDQLKRFQAYPFQPQNMKMSQKKKEKMIKQQKWQKTIHQMLKKNNHLKQSQKGSIKSQKNSQKSYKSNSRVEQNKKSQISSIKAKNSQQSSQIFSISEYEGQNYIKIQKDQQISEEELFNVFIYNKNKKSNDGNVNAKKVQTQYDVKDCQTDDVSLNIKSEQKQKIEYRQRQEVRKKSPQSNNFGPQFNNSPPSSYTQIFLKKLHRPHKKSADIQESLIFTDNQVKQKQLSDKNRSNNTNKTANFSVNQAQPKNYKGNSLTIGKDKEMIESFQLQLQLQQEGETNSNNNNYKEHQIFFLNDSKSFQEIKKKTQKNINSRNQKLNIEQEKALDCIESSQQHELLQKQGTQMNKIKSFEESKSLKLLRETIPSLPTELVKTYLTIYNRLLQTQVQNQQRMSRQKLLLDVLQMLIYFNKNRIDCESFLIQRFESVQRQNNLQGQDNNQEQQFIKSQYAQNQIKDNDQNEKTVRMNQVLLIGLIKKLAAKIQ